MKSKVLKSGKLNVRILNELLQRYCKGHERLLVGPRIGEDAAAIDMGERVLIVATDPITFTTNEIGYYSVMVNANDVATTGAEPRWYSVTILLPGTGGTRGLVDSIFQQTHKACEELGVSLIGGHTEITHGLDRPILVGQMIGEVQKEALITTGGAKPGDLILLSKGICIEGTSIIAREREGDLCSRGIPVDLVERAGRFLFDPGISVVEEARLAFQTGRVHSMHDVTEGGLADGLHELSIAAGVEIEVEKDRIPIYEESRVLCEAFGLNPLGVIASGALLITAPPGETEKILDRAHQHGVAMTMIGRVQAAGPPSVTMVTSTGYEQVPYFDRDEVARIF
ncbi:MAG: AIR synthase family protein [Deltaproteobacteria bacterium]|nr:MAG: AIR synthase family protein [Deltaproteobacteria bacterium]